MQCHGHVHLPPPSATEYRISRTAPPAIMQASIADSLAWLQPPPPHQPEPSVFVLELHPIDERVILKARLYLFPLQHRPSCHRSIAWVIHHLQPAIVLMPERVGLLCAAPLRLILPLVLPSPSSFTVRAAVDAIVRITDIGCPAIGTSQFYWFLGSHCLNSFRLFR